MKNLLTMSRRVKILFSYHAKLTSIGKEENPLLIAKKKVIFNVVVYDYLDLKSTKASKKEKKIIRNE
jgi:hypothetical protein